MKSGLSVVIALCVSALSIMPAQGEGQPAEVSALKRKKAPRALQPRIVSAEPAVIPQTEAAERLSASIVAEIRGSVTGKSIAKALRSVKQQRRIIATDGVFSAPPNVNSDGVAVGSVSAEKGKLFVTYLTLKRSGEVLAIIEAQTTLPATAGPAGEEAASLKALGYLPMKSVLSLQLAVWSSPSTKGLSETVSGRPSFISGGLLPKDAARLLALGGKVEAKEVSKSAVRGSGIPATVALSAAGATTENPAHPVIYGGGRGGDNSNTGGGSASPGGNSGSEGNNGGGSAPSNTGSGSGGDGSNTGGGSASPGGNSGSEGNTGGGTAPGNTGAQSGTNNGQGDGGNTGSEGGSGSNTGDAPCTGDGCSAEATPTPETRSETGQCKAEGVVNPDPVELECFYDRATDTSVVYCKANILCACSHSTAGLRCKEGETQVSNKTCEDSAGADNQPPDDEVYGKQIVNAKVEGDACALRKFGEGQFAPARKGAVCKAEADKQGQAICDNVCQGYKTTESVTCRKQ